VYHATPLGPRTSGPHGLIVKWFFGTVAPSSEWAYRQRYLTGSGNDEGMMWWLARGGFDWHNPAREGIAPGVVLPRPDLSNSSTIIAYNETQTDTTDDNLEPVGTLTQPGSFFMGDFVTSVGPAHRFSSPLCLPFRHGAKTPLNPESLGQSETPFRRLNGCV
jgi:hypothetical protein